MYDRSESTALVGWNKYWLKNAAPTAVAVLLMLLCVIKVSPPALFPDQRNSWDHLILENCPLASLAPGTGAGLHLITSRLCLIRSNWAIISQQRRPPSPRHHPASCWASNMGEWSQYILYSAPEVWVVWSPGLRLHQTNTSPHLHPTLNTQHSLCCNHHSSFPGS